MDKILKKLEIFYLMKQVKDTEKILQNTKDQNVNSCLMTIIKIMMIKLIMMKL